MADVILPQLGETVTEGTITQWFKQVGDTIAVDEPLFEVSTDKVDTEVPSPITGVVSEIRVAEGDTIDVGTVVAVVAEAGAEPEAAPAAPEAAPAAPEPAQPAEAAPAASEVAPPAPVPTPAPSPTPVAAEAGSGATEPAAPPATPAPLAKAGDRRLLSPVVRRLINEHGIDPDTIEGTGPGGRITRTDVLDRIDASAAGTRAPLADAPAPVAASPAPAPAPAPAPSAPAAASEPSPRPPDERDTVVPLSKIRRLTGAHMVMSKATSPHAFSVVEIDFANVDHTRARVKQGFKADEGFSLTYLPFIARAIVDGLAEFPHLNASVVGDDLVVHRFIDLGIAVDLAYEGLLAPVVRSAETKRLKALAREISDLANRARDRKLSPDEISGGTFTISNNGSAGSVLTMPIINQPQVGIISTDLIVRRPVVTSGPGGEEAIAVHPVGNLAMSWDHRAFDGAYAAGFLKRVKQILETRDWDVEL